MPLVTKRKSEPFNCRFKMCDLQTGQLRREGKNRKKGEVLIGLHLFLLFFSATVSLLRARVFCLAICVDCNLYHRQKEIENSRKKYPATLSTRRFLHGVAFSQTAFTIWNILFRFLLNPPHRRLVSVNIAQLLFVC